MSSFKVGDYIESNYHVPEIPSIITETSNVKLFVELQLKDSRKERIECNLVDRKSTSASRCECLQAVRRQTSRPKDRRSATILTLFNTEILTYRSVVERSMARKV